MRDTDENGAWMQFFLCEIVARIVAAYLCVDCVRMLRDGYTKREIRASSRDFLDLLLDWSRQLYQRDTQPGLYWMEMGHQAICLAACLVVAIHGWWLPNG